MQSELDEVRRELAALAATWRAPPTSPTSVGAHAGVATDTMSCTAAVPEPEKGEQARDEGVVLDVEQGHCLVKHAGGQLLSWVPAQALRPAAGQLEPPLSRTPAGAPAWGCPRHTERGHGLELEGLLRHHRCDVCEASLPGGKCAYRCLRCDYDVCLACAAQNALTPESQAQYYRCTHENGVAYRSAPSRDDTTFRIPFSKFGFIEPASIIRVLPPAAHASQCLICKPYSCPACFSPKSKYSTV